MLMLYLDRKRVWLFNNKQPSGSRLDEKTKCWARVLTKKSLNLDVIKLITKQGVEPNSTSQDVVQPVVWFKTDKSLNNEIARSTLSWLKQIFIL